MQELMEFRRDMPFDHVAGLVALHNEIVNRIKRELWEFRETRLEPEKISHPYVACNAIFNFKSLQPIE